MLLGGDVRRWLKDFVVVGVEVAEVVVDVEKAAGIAAANSDRLEHGGLAEGDELDVRIGVREMAGQVSIPAGEGGDIVTEDVAGASLPSTGPV